MSSPSPANRFAALAAALLVAACASPPRSPEAFAFAVLGDTPYSDREEARFLAMMRGIDAEELEFVVHVGDMKSGGSPCTDALFERRRAQFDASAHPFIYTPGDNEWTDCRRSGTSPIERLARLREVFFPDAWSLGRRRIATAFQDQCIEGSATACTCPAHPENRIWSHGRIRFVTLDIPGSDNNVGYDAANDAEARCRNEANRRWLERAATESAGDDTRALVVLTQADPWRTAKRPSPYRGFLAQLQQVAARLAKPVLFVHGDTHTYRADRPFVDAVGEPVANLSRLEGFGSPIVGWVKVTADPASPEVFRFEPRIEAVVP